MSHTFDVPVDTKEKQRKVLPVLEKVQSGAHEAQEMNRELQTKAESMIDATGSRITGHAPTGRTRVLSIMLLSFMVVAAATLLVHFGAMIMIKRHYRSMSMEMVTDVMNERGRGLNVYRDNL